jgi:LemA protein
MTREQIVVLALAAVLVFWMVGAYNRLVALRNAIGAAWQLVDEVLKRRGEAVQALLGALREPLAGEMRALEALAAAEQQVRSAADALGHRPVMAAPAAALVAAEAKMGAASTRVLSLVALQPELASEAAVAPHRAVLEDSAARLAFARQLFNEATTAYNAAARQFPTRLLTRLYGFGTAGRI